MKTDLFLNATALGLLSCDRKYQISALWGYTDSSPEANFGTNLHDFIKLHDGPPHADIETQCKEKLNSNIDANDKLFLKTCIFYQTFKPLGNTEILVDNEGKLALEYSFSFPYLATEDYRIILCGTIDRIDISGGCTRILDAKSSRKAKIQEVLEGYEFHIQIPFYLWVYKRFLEPLFPVNTRNLIGQYHGIFLSFEPTKFQLSNPILYTDNLASDMENYVLTAAKKMIAIHMLGADLAAPTGMAANLGDNTLCLYCFMKNLCRTRKHTNIINYLKTLTPVPYDPRTWH